MADNYKILGQTTAASLESSGVANQANAVYTVPANTQASISSISLVNTSATAESYSLGVLKSQDISLAVSPEASFPFILMIEQNNKYFYSFDGTTWLESFFPTTDRWHDIAYGAGKIVVLGSKYNVNAQVGVSEDGANWTYYPDTELNDFYSDPYPTRIAFGNNVFVAAGSLNSSSRIAYSSDGITWSLAQIENSQSGNYYNYCRGLEFGNNTFLAIYVNQSNTNTFLLNRSIDFGRTWQTYTVPYTSSYSRMKPTYGADKWVMLFNSEASTSSYLYSTDGITWSQGQLPSSRIWKDIVYTGQNFVVAGAQGYVAYSADGINWQESFTIAWPGSFGGGRARLVKDNRTGRVLYQYYLETQGAYSDDGGATWTPYTRPTTDEVNQLPLDANFLPATQALPQSNTIVPNRSIEPNQVDEIVGGITLSAGDQIRVYSESEDLIVQVYGVEIA